ncbi:MAG: hypothetical protein CMO40_04765 [Verrucomicrobiaceae bacterium]|nr:hypothetical protein [Verrucomicrobiaceae bacterium]
MENRTILGTSRGILHDSPLHWVNECVTESSLLPAIDEMSGDEQRFRDSLTPIIKPFQAIEGPGP